MSRPTPALPVRRNTLILAATLAVNSAVLQLVAAVSSLTFVLVTGVKGLLGLGSAIFLSASALTGAPAVIVVSPILLIALPRIGTSALREPA